MAKQKNAKRKNQLSTTKAKSLAKSTSAVEANEGSDDGTTLDVKRLAVMLFILGILIIPLALFLSNVDGMTEDVFRNKYNNNGDASQKQQSGASKASKSSEATAATAEKKKENKSIQNKPLIDLSKFKSSWDIAMHFSKDYDSLGSK